LSKRYRQHRLAPPDLDYVIFFSSNLECLSSVLGSHFKAILRSADICCSTELFSHHSPLQSRYFCLVSGVCALCSGYQLCKHATAHYCTNDLMLKTPMRIFANIDLTCQTIAAKSNPKVESYWLSRHPALTITTHGSRGFFPEGVSCEHLETVSCEQSETF